MQFLRVEHSFCNGTYADKILKICGTSGPWGIKVRRILPMPLFTPERFRWLGVSALFAPTNLNFVPARLIIIIIKIFDNEKDSDSAGLHQGSGSRIGIRSPDQNSDEWMTFKILCGLSFQNTRLDHFFSET